MCILFLGEFLSSHFGNHVYGHVGLMHVDCMACSDPHIVFYLSPGLSLAYGFEHPASTLPTRFPAALGIGHDLPAA